MERLSEDFSKYQEFINIYMVIKGIKEFENINNKIINDKNINVKKCIENYTENIFDEFSELQKNVLNEIISWSNDNNFIVNWILKSSKEDQRKVFEYIYWLCKIDSKKMRYVKIQPLKNLLGFKRGDAYYKDISINQVCPVCNNVGCLFIREYGNLKKNYFECSKCNHRINNKEECECSFCNEIKNELYITLKENLVPLLERVDSTIRKLNEEEVYIDEYEEKMLEDYKLYRLNLDKDMREILSFKPKSSQELLRIIERIDKRNSIYKNNNYKNSIIKKLLDNYIIYCKEKKSYCLKKIYKKEKGINDSYSDFIDTRSNIDDIKEFFIYENIESFSEYNYLKLEDGYRISMISKHTCENQNKFKYINISFLLGYEYFIEPFIYDEIIMNKYFFEYNNKLINHNNQQYVKNVFQSEAEKDMYIDLINKYPNNIILINYKIKDLIDLNQLKNNLSNDEVEYLTGNSEFNFTICDLEGNIKKVVQVQRGIHHNQKEWIWRDSVKEKVSKLCGIEYEEVF